MAIKKRTNEDSTKRTGMVQLGGYEGEEYLDTLLHKALAVATRKYG